MIEVPYHKQEFWFSCLPACIKMLLGYYIIKVEEKELRRLFKTTVQGGTNWTDVVNGIKKFNIDFVYLKNQNFSKLKGLIEDGTPAVVSVDTRKLGDFSHRQHTIVVIDIKESYITVHDPEKGPNMQIDVNEFINAWKDRLNRIGYISGK